MEEERELEEVVEEGERRRMRSGSQRLSSREGWLQEAEHRVDGGRIR